MAEDRRIGIVNQPMSFIELPILPDEAFCRVESRFINWEEEPHQFVTTKCMIPVSKSFNFLNSLLLYVISVTILSEIFHLPVMLRNFIRSIKFSDPYNESILGFLVSRVLLKSLQHANCPDSQLTNRQKLDSQLKFNKMMENILYKKNSFEECFKAIYESSDDIPTISSSVSANGCKTETNEQVKTDLQVETSVEMDPLRKKLEMLKQHRN